MLEMSPAGSNAPIDARRWLKRELDEVFPNAEDLLQEMQLVQTYKDVTFETLNRKEFLPLIQKAFSAVDWEKTYKEFRAAGEATSREDESDGGDGGRRALLHLS